MRSLVIRLGASLVSGGVLLMILWSLLFTTVPVRSGSARIPEPVRASIITDTRWVELVRSGAAGTQQTRSTSAQPTINLHLIDNLIVGRVPSSARVTIAVWRNNSPIVETVVTPYPDGTDYFYVAQLGYQMMAQGGGGYATLQTGDVIALTQGGASFTLTVPALTAMVDAPADRVYGTAPISRSVTSYLYSDVTGTGPYTQTVEADADGNYTADYAAMLDVRPRDNGYVAYSETPGRTTYVRFVAPFLRAQAGGAEISGMAAPLSWINLTVVNAAGESYGSWSMYSVADGSFGDTYSSYGGAQLRPGDRITATSAGQTFTMRVLTLTVQSVLDNGLVEGNAPPDQPLELLRFDGPLCCTYNAFWRESPAEQPIVTATATGYYSAALSLARPNYGAAIVTDPDGNQTYARFAMPYLAVRLGGYAYWLPAMLTGQISEAAAPITIAIQGPSGYLKDVRSAPSTSSGYFADYGYTGLALDSGDVITVSTAHGVQTALHLPPLTGEIDPVTDIVSGTAPPGARLQVALNSYGISAASSPYPTPTPYYPGGGGGLTMPFTVIVTATAQGEYLVNLHGVIDLLNYSFGEVSLTTPEGHAVTRVLGLRQEECVYRPAAIQVGGNRVDFGEITTGCKQAVWGMARLRDAAGNLKAEQPFYAWSWFSQIIYFYAEGQPVAIAPGDSVEVEWSTKSTWLTPAPVVTVWPVPTYTPYLPRPTGDNHFIAITVPTLTVQLDRAANTLSGQAPANSIVALSVSRGNDFFRTYTATVDALGGYTLNLPGDVALAAGDVARVSYKSIDPPTFSATGILPLIRAELYQSSVSGRLPPLTAYTITLQTSPTVTLSYQGIAFDDGYFGLWLAPTRPGDIITVTTVQQTLRLELPALTAHIDRTSATIFGQAPPLASLRVMPYAYFSYSQNVTATASGAYTATFPDLAPLNTTYGQLTYYDADGNQVGLAFATVHWDVVVNDKCLSGIADLPGLPLTLTLRNSSGGVKSTYSFIPAYSYYAACFTTIVESGDQIALQSASATEVFTVPVLTARHNFARQAVEGSAPPHETLFAELPAFYNGPPRRVFADDDGRYGVDTSDLHPTLLSRGRVYVYDEAYNSTLIYFTVTGYSAFLPLLWR